MVTAWCGEQGSTHGFAFGAVADTWRFWHFGWLLHQGLTLEHTFPM